MSNPLPNAYGFSGLPGFDDSGDVLSGWDTHTCFDDCDDELGPDSAMLRLLSRASDNDPDAGLVSANSLGNRLLDGHGIVAEASTSGTTSNSLGYAAQLKAEKVRGTVIESPRQKCRHREKRSNDDPRFTGVNSEVCDNHFAADSERYLMTFRSTMMAQRWEARPVTFPMVSLTTFPPSNVGTSTISILSVGWKAINP